MPRRRHGTRPLGPRSKSQASESLQQANRVGSEARRPTARRPEQNVVMVDCACQTDENGLDAWADLDEDPDMPAIPDGAPPGGSEAFLNQIMQTQVRRAITPHPRATTERPPREERDAGVPGPWRGPSAS